MSGGSIQTKRGLELDRVVLLGRTFEEYRRYFLLEPDHLIGKKVLDVAGGVSSFCAEANKLGINVTSFDPIYSLSPEKIMERSEPDLEAVYRAIGSVPTYRWGYYKNPDYMRKLRKRASMMFLSDYENHRECYEAGELPSIDSSNHACDARRGAHLSDSDVRSTTKRICSNAVLGSGAATVCIHGNQNRFRVSCEFQLVFEGDTRSVGSVGRLCQTPTGAPAFHRNALQGGIIAQIIPLAHLPAV
jgi:hypothetical protein